MGKPQSRFPQTAPEASSTTKPKKTKKSRTKTKTRKVTLKNGPVYQTEVMLDHDSYEAKLQMYQKLCTRAKESVVANGHAVPVKAVNGDCKPRRSQSLRIPKTAFQPYQCLPKISVPSTSSGLLSKSSMGSINKNTIN